MFPASTRFLTILNAALCEPSTARHWTSFASKSLTLISNPLWVISTLLVLLGGLCLLPNLGWRRLLTRITISLLLLYLVASSTPAIAVSNQLLGRLVPADLGEPADAIVVLGRGGPLQNSRVATVAQLWQSKRAPLIFASGRVDAPKIAKMLEAKGIPKSAIDGEGCSSTTEENAQYTAALLHTKGVRRIVLVTDTPHMLRSLLTFRSFGFEVIPHASSLTPNLSSKKQGFLVYREYVGLLSYGLLGRFSPRQPTTTLELSQPLELRSSR